LEPEIEDEDEDEDEEEKSSQDCVNSTDRSAKDVRAQILRMNGDFLSHRWR
jgi:hypothetical protein